MQLNANDMSIMEQTGFYQNDERISDMISCDYQNQSYPIFTRSDIFSK